jgi:xanthine dehydrogenase accessory factor
MNSTDLSVLRSAVSWLKAGHSVAIATVVQTWGSAPRPIGSWLAIRDDGQVAGSVSGGCVEDDLIRRVQTEILTRAIPEMVVYDKDQQVSTIQYTKMVPLLIKSLQSTRSEINNLKSILTELYQLSIKEDNG